MQQTVCNVHLTSNKNTFHTNTDDAWQIHQYHPLKTRTLHSQWNYLPEHNSHNYFCHIFNNLELDISFFHCHNVNRHCSISKVTNMSKFINSYTKQVFLLFNNNWQQMRVKWHEIQTVCSTQHMVMWVSLPTSLLTVWPLATLAFILSSISRLKASNYKQTTKQTYNYINFTNSVILWHVW